MDIGQYGKCLISLIKSAILDYDAEDLPKDTDIDTLIRLSKIHKVSNIIYPVLEKKGITSLELTKDFHIAVVVEANQQLYLEKIKERFEKEQIRFVCMKGAYLKTLYPETYMRYSADLDIFVDDENTDKVHDIMTELGFTTKRFCHQVQDDVYTIGKLVSIEIHRKLISNKCPWDEKCQDIIKRIVPKSEGSYEYVMTVEDFYLHMIGHMAKHMKYSGFGIRMLVDVWIYLNKLSDTIDRKILDERLKYCGLDVFEKEVVKLVDYWFNDKPADEKTKKFGEYVINSGIFGSETQYNATQMSEDMGSGKSHKIMIFKKLWKMLFLPYRDMCLIYPNLSGKRILIPFYWIIRAFDIILHKNNKNKIDEVSKKYDNIDVEYAKEINSLKKGLGL